VAGSTTTVAKTPAAVPNYLLAASAVPTTKYREALGE
jgi:hypothetical protein